MDAETIQWIAGALMIPGLAWATSVIWLLRDIKMCSDKLMEMLERPERHGFGTSEMSKVVSDNTKAIRELSHYVKWSAEQTTGAKPPPYVGSVGE